MAQPPGNTACGPPRADADAQRRHGARSADAPVETRTCPFLAVWPPESRNAPRCPVPTGLSPRPILSTCPLGQQSSRGPWAQRRTRHARPRTGVQPGPAAVVGAWRRPPQAPPPSSRPSDRGAAVRSARAGSQLGGAGREPLLQKPQGRAAAGRRGRGPLEGRRPLWEGGLLTRSAPARLFSPGARASRAAHAGGAGPRAPRLPRGRSPLARPVSHPRGRCAHASARRVEERPPGRVPTRVPRRPRPRPQVPDVCPLRPATGPRTGGVRKPLRRLRPGAAGGCSGTNRSDGSCRSRRQGGAARAGEGRGDSGLCCPAELTARRRVRGGAPCALPDPTPSPAAHEEPQVSARAGQAAPPAPRPDSSPTRVAGHVPPCVCVSVRGDVHTRVQPQKQGACVLDRALGARSLGTRRHVRFVPGTPRAAEAAWL